MYHNLFIYSFVDEYLGWFHVLLLLFSHWAMSDTMTPRTEAPQASLSFTMSQSFLNSCPLSWWCHRTISSSVTFFFSCPQSFLASGSFPMNWLRWPKYWSLSFSIRTFNEYSGSILFRIDWFDLLGVQGILKSLIQHHNWKSSIVQHSAFFMVQSPYYFIIFSNFLLLNLSHLIQV